MQKRIACPCGARVRWAFFRRTIAEDVVAANLEAVEAEVVASCPTCSRPQATEAANGPVAREGETAPNPQHGAPKAQDGEAGPTQGPNKRGTPTKRKGPRRTKRKDSRHAAK